MRNYCLIIVFVIFSILKLTGQNPNGIKSNFIKSKAYLLKSGWTPNLQFADSLDGFDEQGQTKYYLDRGISSQELPGHMAHLKREYINNKFGLVKHILSPYKTIGEL